MHKCNVHKIIHEHSVVSILNDIMLKASYNLLCNRNKNFLLAGTKPGGEF